MKTSTALIIFGVVALYVWNQKKNEQIAINRDFGFGVLGLRADHFGRPATIDGVTGILI